MDQPALGPRTSRWLRQSAAADAASGPSGEGLLQAGVDFGGARLASMEDRAPVRWRMPS